MRFWVAALFALAWLATACKPAARKAVFVDPALEIMVPADATFATGADLDAIRTTHVFQKYLGQISLPQLDDFTKKTGIDPRKNLWQILSCSNGKTALFMARGRFSFNDEEPRIQIEGVKRMGYKGYNLFGNEQSSVIFMNTSTAVAGRTDDLHTLVDLRNQGTRGFPAALKEKVASIGHDNQIWAAFTGGLQNVNLGVSPDSNAGQVLQVMRGIESGTLGANLKDGFGFEARLDCKSPNDAKLVHDAIKGVIGLGRLSTPDNQPELLQLYDAIHVKLDQTRVEVTATVPGNLEDKFLDLWLKKR